MRNDEVERGTESYLGPLDIPDDYEPSEQERKSGEASLVDDVVALFSDGKTYAEAELAFQKSRAGYTANRAKGAIAFGLAAFGVFHLALIAATVGLVIALVPLIGPWGATAVVTLALIVIGIVLLRMLKGRVDDIRTAFSEGTEK
jgi:hypothetical protein